LAEIFPVRRNGEVATVERPALLNLTGEHDRPWSLSGRIVRGLAVHGAAAGKDQRSDNREQPRHHRSGSRETTGRNGSGFLVRMRAMWQAYVRFKSGSTTRADVADNEDDARKALEDAMGQLKSNGIGSVGPSLVVTMDDLEFIKLEQKQQER